MLYALYKEGPEILNIVQIQVVQFVWWFMDFFTNGYRRQKIWKENVSDLIYNCTVLQTLKSDVYESRLMYSRIQAIV